MTVTSARPSAELVTLPPNKSLRKDIPIPAKHLSTKAGEPITSVVKSGEVKAEIESKRLILPPRLTMVKSEEDRERMYFVSVLSLFSRELYPVVGDVIKFKRLSL